MFDVNTLNYFSALLKRKLNNAPSWNILQKKYFQIYEIYDYKHYDVAKT